MSKQRKLGSNLFMMFVMLFYLLPLWYTLNNAFKKSKYISTNPFTLSPKSFTFDNIVNAFKALNFSTYFFNSLIILVISCVMLIVLGSLAAFGIIWSNNRIMNRIYVFFVALISVPFQIAIVPLGIILKDLHLINTYLGVALVYSAMLLPFVIFLYTGFMRTIPKELAEAAMMDGCGPFRTYFHIYMPLLKTITGIVLIIRGVFIWNDLLVPLIVLNQNSMYTLPLQLYIFSTSRIGQWDIVFGGTLLVSFPIIVFFLLFQRSFIKGITSGGIKG